MKPTPKRILWIDIAKGFAIFLIVCGHCADKNDVDRILLHFSMFAGVAVFFFLSGMTFCWKENSFLYFDRRPFRVFLRGLSRGIIVPYTVWSLISISIYQVFGATAAGILQSDRSHFSFIGNLAGMLYGNSGSGYMEWNRPLWFLTCLTVTELFWYVFLRILSNHEEAPALPYILLAAICLGSAGWFFYSNLHGIQLCLPWETETTFCILPFFGLGRFVRAWITGHGDLSDRKQRVKFFFFAASCAAVLWALLLGVEDADFRADRFTDPWLFYPEAMLGISAVISFARLIAFYGDTKFGRIAVYVGQRTMAILVMHKFVIMTERVLFSKMGINSLTVWDLSGLNSGHLLAREIALDGIRAVIVVVLCLWAEHILAKIMPWLFGKKAG